MTQKLALLTGLVLLLSTPGLFTRTDGKKEKTEQKNGSREDACTRSAISNKVNVG